MYCILYAFYYISFLFTQEGHSSVATQSIEPPSFFNMLCLYEFGQLSRQPTIV